MGAPESIVLETTRPRLQIPVLFENRSVLAIDKPAGWVLVPDQAVRRGRNLQRVLETEISCRSFWAKSRHIRYIRHIHRLDAETTGVLLLAKHPGVIKPYSRLFESRQIRKTYLAVVQGQPTRPAWRCQDPIGPVPGQRGRMTVGSERSKAADTRFHLLASRDGKGSGQSMVMAEPLTGRTHQIRVHLAQAGHPVLDDPLYGSAGPDGKTGLALRAVSLQFMDPFEKRPVTVRAGLTSFLKSTGWARILSEQEIWQRMKLDGWVA